MKLKEVIHMKLRLKLLEEVQKTQTNIYKHEKQILVLKKAIAKS